MNAGFSISFCCFLYFNIVIYQANLSDNIMLAEWLRNKGKHYDRRIFINNHIKYLQDLLRYGEHNNK